MRLVMILVAVSALTGFAGAQRPAEASGTTQQLGFGRNEYPGDDALPALRRHFSFVGDWLTNPPGAQGTGEQSNSWKGKREVLVKRGLGFLVLASGKEDADVLKAQKTSAKTAYAIGRQEAIAAVSAGGAERLPEGT